MCVCVCVCVRRVCVCVHQVLVAVLPFWWWSPTVSTSVFQTYAYQCRECDESIKAQPRGFDRWTSKFKVTGTLGRFNAVHRRGNPEGATNTGEARHHHPRLSQGTTRRVQCIDGQWTDATMKCSKDFSRTSDHTGKPLSSVLCTHAWQRGYLTGPHIHTQRYLHICILAGYIFSC